jgi:hypothetical protein
MQKNAPLSIRCPVKRETDCFARERGVVRYTDEQRISGHRIPRSLGARFVKGERCAVVQSLDAPYLKLVRSTGDIREPL